MRLQGRFRPIGWVVFGATAITMAVTMALAAPGGAATPTKEYSATFEPTCVIAPGVLNIETKLRANIRATAPEALEEGASFEAAQASSSITSPKELTESFVALGIHEVRGHITNFVLDNGNATPATINAAKPAEFPSGLPFFAPVQKEQAVVFSAPSLKLGEAGRTYSYGPMTVTGKMGEKVSETIDSAAGFVEETEAVFKATGKGVVSEIEGFNEKGEKIIGPLTVACTAPTGVVVAEIPIGPPAGGTTTSCGPSVGTTTTLTSGPPAGTTTSTSSGPPTGTTTTRTFPGPPFSTSTVRTSCTTTPTCPSVTSVSSTVTVEPGQGPASGGTTVILSGPDIERAESVSFGPKEVSFERLPNGDLRVVTPPGRGKVAVKTSGVVIVAPLGCQQERHEGRGTFTYEPVGGTAGEKMVDLGTLGGEWSEAEAINDAGQVVGNAAVESGYRHAFSWTQSGGMVDLGTLGRTESQAVAVSESGQVAGVAYNCPLDGGGCTSPLAFSWTQAGGIIDLGALGGSESDALALNGHGQVVGHAQTSNGSTHAFSWTPAGGMVDLGTLGGEDSWAEAVNEAGEVVGEAETSNGSAHAFSWTQAGGMVDLGTLGGEESVATAVNRSGQIVGDAMPSSTNRNRHAFFWTRAGGMVDLGTLGGTESYANAVNDSGQVVGINQTCPEPPEFGSCGSEHAFSWTRAGGMVDLGALGGNESDAVAVNDSGQVVGEARRCESGECTFRHAFSWTQGGGMVDLGTLGGNESYANAVNESGQVVGRADTSLGTGQAVLWNTGQVEKAEYKNWILSGSLTDKRLAQAITLPAGATFNGSGEVNPATGAGSVTGSFTVPPFTASLKLFGAIPASLGLTLTETAPAHGSVAKSETSSGEVLLSLPLKLNVGVTSVGILGLKIPSKCTTAEPLSLGLTDTLTTEELLRKGWSFAGAATMPKFRCEGGLLGSLYGVVLTSLLSGPENPYSLKVTAPST